MPPTNSSRLEADTAFIKDMISDIKKGEIKIPQFQRKFVWKAKLALDLLDSIANTYPIGSLLLWKTKVKLAVERNIGDFRLPETDDMTPTDYVLDGQQRITVIYSCLGAPDADAGFAAAYDLEQGEFVQKPDEHVPHIFPLRWMFDTTKMLDFRTGLKSYPDQSYQERFDRLINAFNSYRLPIVTLKDLSIEEVCPIFEWINSSGTKLSIFDLMVAATWSHREFDLTGGGHPAAEPLGERLGVQGGADPVEGVVGGDAVGQGQEVGEPFALGQAEGGDLLPGVGAAQDGAPGDGQDVGQQVRLVAVQAGVRQVGEHVREGQRHGSPPGNPAGIAGTARRVTGYCA
jgi:hypothetical protein